MTTQEQVLAPSEVCLRTNLNRLFALGVPLVGSLGRAATYAELVGDPLHEFTDRGEDPLLQDGTMPRDIDVVGWKVPAPERALYSPHYVDDEAFDYETVRLARDGGDWRLTLYPGMPEQQEFGLDASLFALRRGVTILGAPCYTMRPATHFALLSGCNPRIKDVNNQWLLRDVMPQKEKDLLDTPEYETLLSGLSKV